ncbi:RidA family protein [Paenibacillus gorillae]|uniref:RidA family protein n=1 Tax=Paenibacillus gorillae TaxID=1243662 RepID=UPI0005A6B363|nr:RidA family protein [Paenibacillus gorillae]
MTMSIENRLQQLNIVLPDASDPAAKYVNYVYLNGLLFVSGKGPSGNPRGKLGLDYTTEQGYQFARLAGIEVLAVLKTALGSLDKVKRAVKIQGFVNATADYEEHHKVLNGYSDLLIDVFGEKGKHARSVLGAVSVRDNLPIIVDSIFEVEMDNDGNGVEQ